MSQEHSAPFSSNLSHRLIIIFLILTLAVYAAGLTVTLKLRSNAVQDSQAAYLAQAEMFSDQLNNELTRISTQMKYTLTRSVTLWLSLAPNNTSFPQLYEFVLRMTRAEIGSYLGLKLETVSRVLSRFSHDGLIEVNQKHVRIFDPEGLRAIVSGVPLPSEVEMPRTSVG